MYICKYIRIPGNIYVYTHTHKHTEAFWDKLFSSSQIVFYLQHSVPVNTAMLIPCAPVLSVSVFINLCLLESAMSWPQHQKEISSYPSHTPKHWHIPFQFYTCSLSGIFPWPNKNLVLFLANLLCTFSRI